MRIVDVINTKCSIFLEPWPLDLNWILSGSHPVAEGTVISSSGLMSTGYWRCTPGHFDYHYSVDETIFVRSGRAILRDRQSAITIGPNSVVYFQEGEIVEWTVEETIFKFFVINSTRSSLLRRVARRLLR